MPQPQLPLVLELSAWAVLHPGEPLPASCAEQLGALSARGWERLFRTAGYHRLHLMVWSAVAQDKTAELIPEQLKADVILTANQAKARDTLLQLAMLQATEALTKAGIEAILCKGIVLSANYYPRRGLRSMQDIDFWIIGDEPEQHVTVLNKLGFHEVPEKCGAGARNLENQWGVLLDVHTVMTVFQSRGFSLEELSAAKQGANYRLFHPEPLLAHLVVHMLGHGYETGILLTWVLDVLLVLRRHPDLNWELVKRLLPDNGSWEVLLRFIASFGELGWSQPPDELATELAKAPPIPWDLFTRQVTQLPWSNRSGLLRLARVEFRRKFSDSKFDPRPIPSAYEMLLSPWDWLRERSRLLQGKAALFAERDPR